MTDLRKAALSNPNLERKDSNASSQNSSSLPLKMEKTDSVVNLTKPALSEIYREDSYVNLSRGMGFDSHNIEDTPSPSPEKVATGRRPSTVSHVSKPSGFQLPLITKIFLLAGSAFLYNEITKHIHYNHLNNNGLSRVPVTVTNAIIFSIFEKLKIGNYIHIDNENFKTLDKVFSLAIQGIGMASAHPLLDKLLPSYFSKRLLSSNPKPEESRSYSNLLNDLIRASITFLGISYATRKIEWTSFLQVSIIWSLLNPGLWLLLDGTISGFLASLVVSTIACASVYFENYSFINHYASIQYDDSIALCLWIGSFFFCGIIIFGKIGRGLFGSK